MSSNKKAIKNNGSPEQSSDGLKKPARYQRPNRFSTTYFRTTIFLTW
ncbi:MAG: hypothetical protein KAH84_10195 [Thiomargarita sp.]|nr:hypothetical protein [Thiomargarita sp.]